jgi:dihydrolipoamide dehydrogenase
MRRREMGANGVNFGAPQVDLPKLRAWKIQVVGRLTGGLTAWPSSARSRSCAAPAASSARTSWKSLAPARCETSASSRHYRGGFRGDALPFLPKDPRIIDSTGALELRRDPGRLLVIGGGIIGLEMACVYDALGAKVSVVELTPQLMPGCDPDLVRPLEKRIRARYEQILLGTQGHRRGGRADGLQVRFEGKDGASTQRFDRMLVAVGRSPNGKAIGAEAAGVGR